MNSLICLSLFRNDDIGGVIVGTHYCAELVPRLPVAQK
jgi:hypothetical protein